MQRWTPLVIGTNNPAKFGRYQRILNRYAHLEILSPQDLQVKVNIFENGTTAQENAQAKARAYAQHTGFPALGVDEALYIPALPADEQPGVFVRRYAGTELSDKELLNIFLEKARRLAPENRFAQWLYAACLAFPDGQMYADESKYPCCLIAEPRLPYPPGYPLSALMVDVETGKSFSEMSPLEQQIREKPLSEMISRLMGAAGLDSLKD